MPEVISVSEFNTAIKVFIQELGVFCIRGEITEFRISPNKGLFITLSDGKSVLKVGGYAPTIKGLDLIEKDMEVVVTGTPDIYVPYGNFSLAAVNIKPFGEGSLSIAYQKLKEKLEKEGLFDNVHKLSLPNFVTKIALLTGDKSAAYSDFTKILQEHNSGIEVDYYPVIVQGASSEDDILSKLKKVKSLNYDAVVLTRGGGSLEDLSSFNSEEIAREIFSSTIPVIVGVGHEKDESIADFVSDMRASTPSQCAYYLLDQNSQFVENQIKKSENILRRIRENLISMDSGLDNFLMKINSLISSGITNYKLKLSSIDRLLDAYDYIGVLKRGFAMIEGEDGRITSSKSLKRNSRLNIRFSDGNVDATVN
jgi:exodeoxyribonuclease VII large subunit